MNTNKEILKKIVVVRFLKKKFLTKQRDITQQRASCDWPHEFIPCAYLRPFHKVTS